MNRQTISVLAILFLLLASVTHLGCSAGDDASASKGDGEAEPAKVAKNDDGSDESEAGEDGEDEDKDEDAVPVEVAEIQRGSIESVLRFSSNLEAESQATGHAAARRGR